MGCNTYFHDPSSDYHLLCSILGTAVVRHIDWVLPNIYRQVFVVKSRVHIFASSSYAN